MTGKITIKQDVFCGKCGDRCTMVDNDPKEYDITDAQADAAVLSDLTGFAGDVIDEIRDAILDRLHAFYCGTGGE